MLFGVIVKKLLIDVKTPMTKASKNVNDIPRKENVTKKNISSYKELSKNTYTDDDELQLLSVNNIKSFKT